MPPETTSTAPASLPIGIWWDEAGSFTPGQGSSAYLENLVNGLLELDADLELHVLLQPADQPLVPGITNRIHPRLKIYPETPTNDVGSLSARLGDMLAAYHRWSQKRLKAKKELAARLRQRCRHTLERLTGPLLRFARAHKRIALPAMVLLAPVGFGVLWAGYAAFRLAVATLRGLLFPVRLFDRLTAPLLARRPSDSGARDRRRQRIELLPIAHSLRCRTWVLLGNDAYANDLFNTARLLREPVVDDPRDADIPVEVRHLANWFRPLEADPGLYIRGLRPDANSDAEAVHKEFKGLPIYAEKFRSVPPADPASGRTWTDVAREWLPLLNEAADIGWWERLIDRGPIEPWPRFLAAPAGDTGPLKVFLFLQIPYGAGVWEATKDLLRDLVEINRTRGLLELTVGLHEDQFDTRSLEESASELTVKWIRLIPITRSEVERVYGTPPDFLADRSEDRFSFPNGAARTALEADALFALVDRFSLPLLPARPYGVVVYDMIQRRVPEGFDRPFFHSAAVGIAPTVRGASMVLVTSPQTRDDVVAEYGLDPERVRLAPLSCNPGRRFDGLTPEHVALPREPFILNVTNWARHKGGEVIIRAHARLKETLGEDTPLLVLCGWNTHFFSPTYASEYDIAHSKQVRQLVVDLGLREGKDIAFLGFINDCQLLDLYQRCRLVVNAALYDNGSFSLPEGAYFGRPTVSSDYPAAKFLCERFQVPVHLFRTGDADDCARAIRAGLDTPLATATEIELTRARFLDPEFSQRRYAERVYDGLVELAEKGRRERLSAGNVSRKAKYAGVVPAPPVGPPLSASEKANLFASISTNDLLDQVKGWDVRMRIVQALTHLGLARSRWAEQHEAQRQRFLTEELEWNHWSVLSWYAWRFQPRHYLEFSDHCGEAAAIVALNSPGVTLHHALRGPEQHAGDASRCARALLQDLSQCGYRGDIRPSTEDAADLTFVDGSAADLELALANCALGGLVVARAVPETRARPGFRLIEAQGMVLALRVA